MHSGIFLSLSRRFSTIFVSCGCSKPGPPVGICVFLMYKLCKSVCDWCNPPSSSSSSVWELLPICLPFIIQQPPSPCSASINLAFIIQQVRMPPKSKKSIYIGESIRPPQAATGCRMPPQAATGRHRALDFLPLDASQINENQWKSIEINKIN